MRINLDLDTPEGWKQTLEGIVTENRAAIRRGLIPPMYLSGVRYEREKGTEDWLKAKEALEAGVMDCEDSAAWRVAELREKGEDAQLFVVRTGPTTWHMIVRRQDGRIEDQTKILEGKEMLPDDYGDLAGQPIPGLYMQGAEKAPAAAPAFVPPAAPAAAPVPGLERPRQRVRIRWSLRKTPTGWRGTLSLPLHMKKMLMGSALPVETQVGWITGAGRGRRRSDAMRSAARDARRKVWQHVQAICREMQSMRREADTAERMRIDQDIDTVKTLGFLPLASLIPALAPMAAQILPSVTKMIPGLSSLFPGAAPAAPAAAPAIPGLPAGLAQLIPALAQMMPGAAAMPAGVPFVPAAAQAVPSIIEKITKLIPSPIKKAAKKIKEKAKSFFKKLKFWGFPEEELGALIDVL